MVQGLRRLPATAGGTGLILGQLGNQDSTGCAACPPQKCRRNKTDSPEINPCTYGCLIFDQGGKNIQWGKDSLFNKQFWENWTATYKRMNLEHFLTSYTKINSKWIKDLNARPETIKLLEENIGRTLDYINQSKIFYDPPTRVMEIKTKVNKWDLIKLKSFCTGESKVKIQLSVVSFAMIFSH